MVAPSVLAWLLLGQGFIDVRLALRCHDDHRRRWLATAHCERARGSSLPGPQDCGDRKQAARLMAFAWETGVTRFSRPPPRSRKAHAVIAGERPMLVSTERNRSMRHALKLATFIPGTEAP